MDFNYSELQRMLLDSAERFIEGHYTLEHRRGVRAVPDGLDADGWATFAELGWLALMFPEDTGGLGGSMIDAAVLSSALGARCVTEPFTSTAVMVPAILCGSDKVEGDLAEAIIAGEARIAIAHNEPGERYAYSAPRATTVSANGAVSGAKLLVADAPSATHYIVSAEGPDGFSLVLLTADNDGIAATPYPLQDGSRASDLTLNDAAGTILVSGDKARELFALALDRGRIANAAQAVGSMESVLDTCSAYLKERQQFGQPIGKFQALQHIMADMFVATHQARSALYYALSAMEGDAPTRSRAVHLACLQVAQAGQLVSRQGIQLHGGYGVTDEYEVSHHYRRQIVLEKLLGDIDYHTRALAPV